jgi:hypothetical protein
MTYRITPVFFMFCAPLISTHRISCIVSALLAPFAIWIVQTLFLKACYFVTPQVVDLPFLPVYLGFQGILFGVLLAISISWNYQVNIEKRTVLLGMVGGFIHWIPFILLVIFYETRRLPPEINSMMYMLQIIGCIAVVTLPSIAIERALREQAHKATSPAAPADVREASDASSATH